jgi:hypothetical protein
VLYNRARTACTAKEREAGAQFKKEFTDVIDEAFFEQALLRVVL